MDDEGAETFMVLDAHTLKVIGCGSSPAVARADAIIKTEGEIISLNYELKMLKNQLASSVELVILKETKERK